MAKFSAVKKTKPTAVEGKKKPDESKTVLSEEEDDELDDDEDIDDEDEDDDDDMDEEDDDLDNDDDDSLEEDDDDDDDNDEDESEQATKVEQASKAGNQKASPKKSPVKASPTKTPVEIQPQNTSDQAKSKDLQSAINSALKKTQEQRKRPAPNSQDDSKRPKLIDIAGEEFRSQIERTDARDRRTLFIRGFAPGTKDDVLLALSSDIVDVRRPKGRNNRFAYVEFPSEELAEKNLKLLTGKKVDQDELFVDFVGIKSKNQSRRDLKLKPINKLKLYVGGLANGTTEADLKKAFAGSFRAVIPQGRLRKGNYGFVTFKTEEEAKNAYEKSGDKVINGRPVTVMFALMKALKKPSNRSSTKGPKGKIEFEKKKPENQSDDDDDDDDEDDDDDDD